METLKGGKSSEDVYSSLSTKWKTQNSSFGADTFRELPRLRRSPRTETLFEICQAAAFLFLTCALLYCYANLWDLSYQVGDLKAQLQFNTNAEERNSNKLTVKTEQDEIEASEEYLITPKVTEATGEKAGNSFKRKREITLTQEYISGSPEESKDSYRGSSKSFASEKYYSESPANLETSSSRSRKRRKGLRKPKKYHRHAVAAEKFFSELESTTATPVQVRQSRTKQTVAGFELGKHKRVLEHKPLLQVYGSKEFITLEEALRRPANFRNIKSEESGKRSKSENFSQVDASTSKELAESVAYNMIMVHYAADTSHYSRERDSNYCGNGRMQMKENIYRDWKKAHSTQGVDISKYFSLNSGEVTVSVTGIYLIYGQVQYSNLQEVNGYEVVRNKQTVVQCITTSVHPDKHEIKSNTCDTSTTILLYAGDKIYIQDLHHGRHVVLKPEKSYFGLILLSPFKEDKRSP